MPTTGCRLDQAVGDPQAGAGEQVVGQGVAREALEDAEQEQQRADHPVQLARLAERAGDEDAHHVHEHRRDEEHRRPVVHLPHQQAAADVEARCAASRRRRRTSGRRAAGRRSPGTPTPTCSGTNQNVRNMPVSSSTTNDHSAISPSMKDQWSGKTLRQVLPRQRGQAEPVVGPAGHGAGLVRLLAPSRRCRGWCRRSCWCPGTWSASLPETRPDGLGRSRAGPPGSRRRPRSVSSCGSGRAAGPNSTRPASARSKVDWWHGQSRWWVVRSFSEIGQPDVGADLGVADDARRPTSSASAPTRSRSGSIRCRITAALDFADEQVGALDERLWPSASMANITSGSALTRSPISSSATLIGVPTTSRTTRW